ncbi:MAG: peptide deformylase [Caedimonas sp.]|jgi:peptide deformylase|nr:peptide deformylase [Caedimonas sp.]
MTVLKILHVPDPRLKITAQPVEKVDASIARLMEDMLETMYVKQGVGLAATQVGVNQRVIVVDGSETDKPEPLKLANPELLWRSQESKDVSEGCLSVPEQYAEVNRFTRVKFRYLDEHNQTVEREAGGLLAHVIQHEIDHLNGILFLEHLSALKRQMLLRRALKVTKSMAR